MSTVQRLRNPEMGFRFRMVGYGHKAALRNTPNLAYSVRCSIVPGTYSWVTKLRLWALELRKGPCPQVICSKPWTLCCNKKGQVLCFPNNWAIHFNMGYSPVTSETSGPKTKTNPPKKRKNKNCIEKIIINNKRRTHPKGDQSEPALSLSQNSDQDYLRARRSFAWGTSVARTGVLCLSRSECRAHHLPNIMPNLI